MAAVPKAFALVLIAVIALGLTACGGTAVDDHKLEATLTSGEFKVASNYKVKSASCPSGVEVKPGAEFECDLVSTKGIDATLTLKIRDDEANVDFVSLKAPK